MTNENSEFYEENIKELKEGLTPFPEDIFVAEQPWLSKYILPLISIDLGLLRKELKGTIVHMVNPVEPEFGLLGERTTDFHNEYCSENWIAFELTEDNKYRFLAEEGYFLSSDIHKDKHYRDLTEHIKNIHQNYQRVKKDYQSKGKLMPYENGEYDDDYPAFLDNLGNQMWYGNWVDTSPIPSAFQMIIAESSDESLPITYKGKDFIHIAEVAGYNYGDGADAIIMFYEPESRIVLFTYDWT